MTTIQKLIDQLDVLDASPDLYKEDHQIIEEVQNFMRKQDAALRVALDWFTWFTRKSNEQPAASPTNICEQIQEALK